jgi:hypothetical protein
MIIACPKCKSTFSISNLMAVKDFSNFKCSVCMHTWKIDINSANDKLNTKKKLENGYSYIVILNSLILLIAVIALVYFMDDLLYSNRFWTEFYNFFLNLIPIK